MITGDNDMENTTLEALHALIEKIRAGEGTAESNLEALNMLCVLSGGTGKAKSNLEALNELLTVFEAAKPEQVKSVAITENGTTTATPDDGHVLSSVDVDVNVPSKPEQTKSVSITENGSTDITPDAGYVLSSVNVNVNVEGLSKPEQSKYVTITENGMTRITPDEGYTLSGASVSVSVSSGSENNIKMSNVRGSASGTHACVVGYVTEIDFSNVTWVKPNGVLRSFFNNMFNLEKIIWGNFLSQTKTENIDCYYMFYGCSKLSSIDLSPLGAKKITGAHSMFRLCSILTNIVLGNLKLNAPQLTFMFSDCELLETIDTSFLDHGYEGITNVGSMFANCLNLKSIDLTNLYTAKITTVTNMFINCNSLTNVTFENGCFSNTNMKSLDLSYSPLTHDCAVDIFNKLATRTNSPTIQLSTTTKGYLTEDDIAIATAKGWVVS